MNYDNIFSTDKDTIDLHGIDAIVKFTRFHPKKPKIFVEGMELAEDLKNEAGTILYTKGTRI